jgi:hypothetical protein
MRPYPGRFLKWTQVKSLYHSLGNRLYALFLSGEIVVAVVFLEALFIALMLLIIPLLVSTRGTGKPERGQVAYFFAIGAGFMFIEIYFIKRFTILVGDPVVSFAIVIAGVLFFTGLGGIWEHRNLQPRLRLRLIQLILVVALEVVAFELLVPYILKTSISLRAIIALFFLLPAGFLMGMPFPIAIRCLLNSPVQRTYAWSVNGCASVLSSVMAAQVAISWGIAQVAAVGVVSYLLALGIVTNPGSKARISVLE